MRPIVVVPGGTDWTVCVRWGWPALSVTVCLSVCDILVWEPRQKRSNTMHTLELHSCMPASWQPLSLVQERQEEVCVRWVAADSSFGNMPSLHFVCLLSIMSFPR